ncbi:MAG TPA: glycosyltransferase family 4 protein [Planctomycetota bacterium]|nr:glycosyltransferase family 4 protein [Planctomycetota bacterium]
MSQAADHRPRVVYVVPSFDHVCVRHRADVFIPALQARGWRVEKSVIPRGFLRRLKFFRRLRRADVVVVIRKLFTRWQVRVLRWYARKLVFDFDDAVIYRDSSRKDPFSRSRAKRFGAMVRSAERVIAGNDYLARIAERFGGTTSVVPTCVDDGRLTPGGEAARPHGQVVIGWVGSRSTLMSLEGLRGVFADIGRRYGASVLLKVVCDAFPPDMGLKAVKKPWSIAGEPDDLRSFDIGIMPLVDDVWTRGKCGLKLLQYLAAGVPAVASPVGVNTEILRDGENGYLAEDDAAWIEKLGRLINDVDLRRRIGLAGRASLRGRYAVDDWADRYVRLIEETADLATDPGHTDRHGEVPS